MANPVDGVKAAMEIYDNEQKLRNIVNKGIKQQSTDKDKARVNEIKKNQTVPGSKPTPQVNKNVDSDVYRKKAIETGGDKDMLQYIRNSMFSDDKK